MVISTIAKIEHLHNVHSGSPQTTQRNPPQITKIYSMIFKTINSSIYIRTNVLNRKMSLYMI